MMGNDGKEEWSSERVLIKKLCDIQARLNVPKNQYSSFGKYRYRNCEDILEAVKPLLREAGLVLTVTDEIIDISGRFYVCATATIHHGGGVIASTGYAREPESKKGMDEMQITGAASSYARKYALCGLFAIDDNKDADSMDNRTQSKPEAKPTAPDEFMETTPEQKAAYENTAGPHVTKKLRSKLVQICNQRGASPQMMRDWILSGWNKPFDDMTPAEQGEVVATAEREFTVQKGVAV